MPTSFQKYYVYTFSLALNGLQQTLEKLRNSNDIRTKQYFKNGQLEEKKLRTKFSSLTIEEDLLLKGTVEFETAEDSVDLDGNFDLIIKIHKLNFFIGSNPKNHIIILSDSGEARTLSKIVSRIFFNGDSSCLMRLKLNDAEIIKFLDSNKCILKGEYRSTIMEGISTMGVWGPNISKPIEMELINKYLAEHRAVKPLLLDYNWTVWISKNTGVLCCLDSHNPIDFIEFIQKKILSLSV